MSELEADDKEVLAEVGRELRGEPDPQPNLWQPPVPYTREEWDGDPSEGRNHPGRTRVTVDALFAEVAKLKAALFQMQNAAIELTHHLKDIAAKQREADAKVCEKLAMHESRYAPNLADDCAEQIRKQPLVTEKL